MVGPIIDRFAKEARTRIRVATLNIGTSPQTAGRLHILGVPFLFLYDNGQLKETLPGVADLNELRMRLGKYLL